MLHSDIFFEEALNIIMFVTVSLNKIVINVLRGAGLVSDSPQLLNLLKSLKEQCARILLAVVLVRNSKLLATLGTTCSEHATAVLCCHSLAEAVLVHAASVVWLKCSFHRSFVYFIVIVYTLWAAKVLISFDLTKGKAIFACFFMVFF